jgi:hypothetical protein
MNILLNPAGSIARLVTSPAVVTACQAVEELAGADRAAPRQLARAV